MLSFFTVFRRRPERSGERGHRSPAGWLRRRAAQRRERMLAEEAAAFLRGRLADRRVLRSEVVPTWAWTNLLAHGTGADLQRERDCQRVGLGGDVAFLRARSVLAGRILEIVAEGDDLRRLQSELLQPLEIELAHRRDAVRWGSEQWLASVLRALEERRRAPT